MPLTILEAPLNISLTDLQTGIQNQEDSGFQLVDLSKGTITSTGVDVNLVSFQERTENLGNIQLIVTPPNLFSKTGDSYSVQSEVEKPFLQHMADSGLSVVLYCPSVSIQGTDSALAVARVLQTAGSNVDPGPPFSLKCLATCFGFNDPGDQGVGAFPNPSTGRPYFTNNPTLVGAAVPIPILEQSLGSLSPSVVAQHSVCIILGSKSATAPIVDLGPGATVDGQHGLLVGTNGVLHALDMTCGLCAALGVKYDASTGSYEATWWIKDSSGNPLPLKGLNSPRKTV